MYKVSKMLDNISVYTFAGSPFKYAVFSDMYLYVEAKEGCRKELAIFDQMRKSFTEWKSIGEIAHFLDKVNSFCPAPAVIELPLSEVGDLAGQYLNLITTIALDSIENVKVSVDTEYLRALLTHSDMIKKESLVKLE